MKTIGCVSYKICTVVLNAITYSFPQQRNEPGAFSRDFSPPKSSFPMTSTCVREHFSARQAGNALMSKVEAMPASTEILITATLSRKQTHIRDSRNMVRHIHVLTEMQNSDVNFLYFV